VTRLSWLYVTADQTANAWLALTTKNDESVRPRGGISDIGGASGFENGVVGRANRYVSGFGVRAGAWARGITGTLLPDYAADLLLTATGGDF